MIDRVKVVKMIEMNFTKKEISQRLGCSQKQISRIAKELNLEKQNMIKPDYETEPVLREFYLKFESGEQASERFGITRQAILKGV